MKLLLRWFFCRHRELSRVFTIRARSYKVCLECGAEFDYDLGSMKLKRGH